jgi:rubrerythrin
MSDAVDMAPAALSAVCSNLSKACAKQLRKREADLFKSLSDYFNSRVIQVADADLNQLEAIAKQELAKDYPSLMVVAEEAGDRGTQRALTWGKKVTSIHTSLLARYQKQKDALLENNNLYVCEACGFIAVAAAVPDLCPICKAPAARFTKIS